MYEIKIFEDGKEVSNYTTTGFALIFNYADENRIATMSHIAINDDDRDDALGIVMTLDKVRERILNNDIVLKLMYAIRDEITSDHQAIDVSGLSVLKELLEDEDEQDED